MSITTATTSAVAGAPLSPTQQIIFAIEVSTQNNTTYRNELVLRFRGALDVRVLEAAINQVVARHDALRTYFGRAAPAERAIQFLGHVQRAAPDLWVPLIVVDHLSEPEDQWVAKLIAQPFDLYKAPLLKTTIVKTAPTEWLFVMIVHHLIWDGSSVEIFLRECGEAYAATKNEQPWNPRNLPESYHAYAMRTHTSPGDEMETTVAWWKQRFVGAPREFAPLGDRPYPARQDFAAGSVPLVICASDVAKLRKRSEELGATLFMALSSAFAIFLRKHVGPDVVWGTPFANRDQGELDDTIGDFATGLPLRVDLHGDPTVSLVVERVVTSIMDAMEHQPVRFHKLVAAIQGRPQLQRHPLYQVVLGFDSTDASSSFELDDLKAEMVQGYAESCSLNLQFDTWESSADHSIAGRVCYRRDLYDEQTVQNLARDFERIVAAVAWLPAESTISEVAKGFR
jgi:hypothetical protein